jgi:acetyltransferase-like isoleucine patch superfamily enzyme
MQTSNAPSFCPDIGCGHPPQLLVCLLGLPIVTYLSAILLLPPLLLWQIDGLTIALIPVLGLPPVTMLALTTALVSKWLLVGRIRLPPSENDSDSGAVAFADRELGSIGLFRYWLVDRVLLGSIFGSAVGLMAMTPAYSVLLRLFGAKIGKRCLIAGLTIGADIDVIDMGDDVFVGSAVVLVARSTFKDIVVYKNPDAAEAGHTSEDAADEVWDPSAPAWSPRTVRHHRMVVGSESLLAEQVTLLGGATIADGQICGSITLVNKSFPRNSVVTGSPPVMLGYKTREATRRDKVSAVKGIVRSQTADEVNDLQSPEANPFGGFAIENDDQAPKDSKMSKLTQAALTCVPFVPMLTLMGVSFVVLKLFSYLILGSADPLDADGSSTGVPASAPERELSNTDYVMLALCAPFAYWTAFAIMMVCYFVLISVVNIASGKHTLYGAHLVLWSLAGSMQGTIFGLVAHYIIGTPLMSLYLRCLGAKVGKNVFWDTSPPAETKALQIGDGAIVEEGAMILPHTVDHGEMTHGTIRIDDHAIVSSGVNMQPGSHLGVGASLDCLSTARRNR